MTLKFAVVHEATDDFATATELADRVLLECFDWIEADTLVYYRDWLNRSPDGDSLSWKKLKRVALEAGIVVEGHFDGEVAEPDARAGRRAILFLRQRIPELSGIMLIRDQDDQPQRRRGLEQAREHLEEYIPVVVGLATIEREAWVLSGFDPIDEAETEKLEAERQNLGFQPHHQSHQLTACKADQAKRSPKRVLEFLSGGDPVRERRCWVETPLPTLRERGIENGLAAYLDEVRHKLAPLIGHIAPPL